VQTSRPKPSWIWLLKSPAGGSRFRLEALQNVMRQLGIDSFSQEELAEISTVWQRLRPWPGVAPELRRLRLARYSSRLKQKYILATLSNADMADMVRLARHSNLPWDLILTSELVQAVKPDPKVYEVAPRYLGVKPEEILMVASHKPDLQGAKEQGLRTAFVPRPLELGPKGKVDAQADAQFDLNAASFVELADLLNA
jgi:2-haloacid dehalogenase